MYRIFETNFRLRSVRRLDEIKETSLFRRYHGKSFIESILIIDIDYGIFCTESMKYDNFILGNNT